MFTFLLSPNLIKLLLIYKFLLNMARLIFMAESFAMRTSCRFPAIVDWLFEGNSFASLTVMEYGKGSSAETSTITPC